MNFTDDQIMAYSEAHTTPETEVLHNLSRFTHLTEMIPQMLTGGFQGKFLEFVSYMVKPECILEIGTFTGYSAICLAKGLQPKGVLHTIEINEELESTASEYFEKAGLVKQIRMHIGNATEIIPIIDREFDLVFIDADKENYSNYYNLVFNKVRPGGFILADNVLWSGRVVGNDMDKDALALDAYNKKVFSDSRVDNILVPIRDGIMIARKKQ